MSDNVRVLIWIISFVTAFVLLLRLLRCTHQWELVDKTEFPSALEEMRKNGVTSAWIMPWEMARLAQKTAVLALRCSKCGASRIEKICSGP